jgi:hypothetical protein
VAKNKLNKAAPKPKASASLRLTAAQPRPTGLLSDYGYFGSLPSDHGKAAPKPKASASLRLTAAQPRPTGLLSDYGYFGSLKLPHSTDHGSAPQPTRLSNAFTKGTIRLNGKHKETCFPSRPGHAGTPASTPSGACLAYNRHPGQTYHANSQDD